MVKRHASRKDSVDEHASSAGEEEAPPGDGPKVDERAKGKQKKSKENWRLNMLSVPKTLTPKYLEEPYVLDTGVQKDALGAVCTDRNDQLAISNIRRLKVNKTVYTPLRGPDYGKRMDTYIQKSWNSIYNYYRKSLHDLRKKKAEQHRLQHRWSTSQRADRKGKKGKGKDRYKVGGRIGSRDSKVSERSREIIMKELDDWCLDRSKPKAKIEPPPIDRGPHVDLDEIKARQDERAMPKRVRRSSSQDSKFKDPQKISPAALTYEPTERILVLATPTANRLLKVEEMVPGSVKPSALTYEVTDRVKLLATPKPTLTARESDLNEDAFTISPAALKYVASPRILEMAKPKEYSF